LRCIITKIIVLKKYKKNKKFAENYPDPNCAAAAAQIPWGHNLVIMDKVENSDKQL
jgi:hypothetical protein